MEDYEALYNHYRSKYYEACAEVNRLECNLADWKNQRQSVLRSINELEANKRKINDAIADLQSVLNLEATVDEKLSAASKKLDDASENYSAMVKASDVSSKNLNDVFSEEARNTRTAITDVFGKVKQRQGQLQNQLTEVNNQLSNANSQLSDLNSHIRSGETALYNWTASRNNHLYTMNYYKRKIQSMPC